MAIPERKLEAWSNQGAVTASADTYNSIRAALQAYEWPEGMSHEAYLQGSYANATNIRGNSDVDLVVETDSVFYSTLTDEEKARLGLDRGRFGFREFRPHVVQALRNYYGNEKVDVTGDKSIKIAAEANRLKVDVVPAVHYKEYMDLRVIAEGITFWGQRTGIQIINFPKATFPMAQAKMPKDARTAGSRRPCESSRTLVIALLSLHQTFVPNILPILLSALFTMPLITVLERRSWIVT